MMKPLDELANGATKQGFHGLKLVNLRELGKMSVSCFLATKKLHHKIIMTSYITYKKITMSKV